MRAALASVVLTLASVVAARAHVVVLPRESQASSEQRYTVRVPTEGQVTTSSVELEVPDGLLVTNVPESRDYRIELRRDGDRILSITWIRDIAPRDVFEFSFVARNPGSDLLVWKARQRFADGSSADWIGEPGARRPASRTTLRATQ